MSASTRTENSDYYALLGVAPTADAEALRHAYRSLARRLHPDVNSDPDAAERFAAVARAYETLSDPERRRRYDLSRRIGAGPSPWSGAGTPEGTQRPIDPMPPRGPALRGLDVSLTVHLSLREAAFGTNKTIVVPRHDVCLTCRGSGGAVGARVRQCPRCHGTGRGFHPGEECDRCRGNGAIALTPCPFCNGLGRVAGETTFPLHFPPAIEDDEVLRIKNEGEPGPQGGPRGDMRLHIVVDPDPVLRRRGSEVYADLDIDADQAARGARISVPTLHGSTTLRLPRGVVDGATLLLPRKGLRLKGRWRRGNQHVTVHIRR